MLVCRRERFTPPGAYDTYSVSMREKSISPSSVVGSRHRIGISDPCRKACRVAAGGAVVPKAIHVEPVCL